MATDSTPDTGYKLIFSHAVVVEDLLLGFVGEDWVEELDFSTLEKSGGSYVTDDLREREDDVIWRIRRRDGWLYIYLLLEFQSAVDPWMALRILVYTGLLYQDLIRKGEVGRGEKLPAVFPLVIYNGRDPWGAARDVGELIEELPGSLKCYRPMNRYFLLEEASVDEAQLADESNTVGGIIRIEQSGAPADIRRAVARLHLRLQGPQYDSLRRALVVWINRVVLRRLMPGQTIAEVNELQEIDTMLAETVDSWARQWKEDGLREGRLEGRLEGESTLLQKLFERRFGPLPDWARQRLLGATTEQLEAWALEILDATTLEDVFRED